MVHNNVTNLSIMLNYFRKADIPVNTTCAAIADISSPVNFDKIAIPVFFNTFAILFAHKSIA